MQAKKQKLELDMEKETPFQIRKGEHQGSILSPCLFNFYAEYIMRNTGLEEAHEYAAKSIHHLICLIFAPDFWGLLSH